MQMFKGVPTSLSWVPAIYSFINTSVQGREQIYGSAPAWAHISTILQSYSKCNQIFVVKSTTKR